MKNFSKKTDVELQKTLNDKREALRKFRFAQSHAKTRNVKEGRDIKKDIARVLTQITLRNKPETIK